MKKHISIVLLIIWMIIIFLMSNSSAVESSNQSGLITTLINRILMLENFEFLDFIIRKSAHLFEYIVLGILMINCFKNYNIKNYFLLAIILCFIYACTDEIHQVFIPGRSGKVQDVLLDTLGSIVGVVSYYSISKRSKNKI